MKLVRVRSRKGVVHLAYTFNNGKTHAHTLCMKDLGDGKMTTRGKVTCPSCVEMRSDKNAMLLLRGTQTHPHPVTNTWKAATRERDGNTCYLAHWVMVPEDSWSPYRKYRLEEHRLYVERGTTAPSDSELDDLGGYYCSKCANVAERKGPDGRMWKEGSPPELPPGAGELEPKDVVANYQNYEGGIGWIPYRDITIHETGRKLPRGNVGARYEEWLREFSRNWRPRH